MLDRKTQKDKIKKIYKYVEEKCMYYDNLMAETELNFLGSETMTEAIELAATRKVAIELKNEMFDILKMLEQNYAEDIYKIKPVKIKFKNTEYLDVEF